MSGPSTPKNLLGRVLLVVAAPAEARAVGMAFEASPMPDASAHARWDWPIRTLCSGFDLVETGIGKVNAAAAVARADAATNYDTVINLGVCGALPSVSAPGPAIGSVVLAGASVYADEGLATESGFQTTAEMGFALGPFAGAGVVASDPPRSALASLADHLGVIATVSTCSGTDALARQVAARTGAIAEAMEGAAIGHVLARAAPRCAFAEVRVVSNTTGDRARQRWDLRGALERLTGLAGAIAGLRADSRT